MKLQTQLKELIGAEVISQQVADNIATYYIQERNAKANPLLVVFGILGSLIGGLGIILILAHNWDNLSVSLKTVIAFAPLLLGQFLAGYSLYKKKGNVVWSESSAVFLFISIGACISLISQIYHISGNINSFIITWMLMGLPLVYLLRSYSSSLIYISGITYYAINQGYFDWQSGESYYFWALLVGVLPFVVWMHKTQKNNNLLRICYWFLSISLIASLGTIASNTSILMHVAYLSLFGAMYNFGHSKWMENSRAVSNGPRILGGIGIIVMLFTYSFSFLWDQLRNRSRYSNGGQINWDNALMSPELLISTILIIISVGLLFIEKKKLSLKTIRPMSLAALSFVLLFILGYYWAHSQLSINIMILIIGILTIKRGAETDNLGILNKGLAVVTILTICRFFDTNISFVFKGIMFMLVGASFFVANYLVIRKRKNN